MGFYHLKSWPKKLQQKTYFFFFTFFILFGFYCLSKLFHSFWAELIARWGKNERSPRKNIWPPQAQLGLSHMWPELGMNTQRWDYKRFRALKISILNYRGHQHNVVTDGNMTLLVIWFLWHDVSHWITATPYDKNCTCTCMTTCLYITHGYWYVMMLSMTALC